jgi:dTMP kinase
MEKRGKFIVLEGIDGSGKTTQIKNIAEFIINKDKYHHLLVTREPYKDKNVREILREGTDPYTKAKELAKIYVQDRKKHVQEVINPSLKSGLHVLSDRYKLATINYQSAQGLPKNKLIEMHQGLPIPNITFIIDTPVQTAKERMKNDSRNEHKFEAHLDFQSKVRENYLKSPSDFPEEKIVIIDGNQSIKDIKENILEHLEKIF